MTASDLTADLTFCALIKTWEEDGKCPEVLIDYLLDHGLETQAECARWCASQGEFYGYGSAHRSGIRPWSASGDEGREVLVWWTLKPGERRFPETIPNSTVDAMRVHYKGKKQEYVSFPTFTEAVVALLDNWIVGAEAELETGVGV